MPEFEDDFSDQSDDTTEAMMSSYFPPRGRGVFPRSSARPGSVKALSGGIGDGKDYYEETQQILKGALNEDPPYPPRLSNLPLDKRHPVTAVLAALEGLYEILLRSRGEKEGGHESIGTSSDEPLLGGGTLPKNNEEMQILLKLLMRLNNVVQDYMTRTAAAEEKEANGEHNQPITRTEFIEALDTTLKAFEKRLQVHGSPKRTMTLFYRCLLFAFGIFSGAILVLLAQMYSYI